METNAVKERERFVLDYLSGRWSLSELCARYGVTRPTGYKWLERWEQDGKRGLVDRSRAPRHCPHETPRAMVELILREAQRKPKYGARKIWRRLNNRYPDGGVPARSTVFDVLRRNGLVTHRSARRKWKHPGVAPLMTTSPNEVWTADFKGHFKTSDGVYCYPLTVADHYSRSLLMCEGLLTTKMAGVKPLMAQLFREVGLPVAIRTDNGAPFAGVGLHGLTQLNVWWMQLGIVHQRIEPASPQQNGVHERMHRSLKAATTRPPGANLSSQQRKFNEFRKDFNEERPHEALNDETPASRWKPSPRRMPTKIRPPEYPTHMEVRKVSDAGTFKIHSSQIFLSQPLANEYVGLEEVDDGVWNIVYYDTLLGRIDEETKEITGAPSLREKCK